MPGFLMRIFYGDLFLLMLEIWKNVCSLEVIMILIGKTLIRAQSLVKIMPNNLGLVNLV